MPNPTAILLNADSVATLIASKGDNLRGGPDNRLLRADACVTDPPYGISFAGDKEWDTFEGDKSGVSSGTGTRTAKAEAESVKKAKDNQQFELWTEGWARPLLKILKPGSHILMFGAANAIHRATSGLENAGFDIRIGLAWCYATGQVKHKAQLRPGFEPITLARVPADDYEKLYKRDGRGMVNAQDWKAEDGKHPNTLLLDESVLTEEFEDPIDNALAKAASYFYVAKPSAKDRDYGCDLLELQKRGGPLGSIDVLCKDCGHKKLAAMGGTASCVKCGSTNVETTERVGLNVHPTVKPIALMRRLVRLITRPGQTVIDPFMGSGTTGIACMLEGRNFIGFEREPDYFKIAEARIRFAEAEAAKGVAA